MLGLTNVGVDRRKLLDFFRLGDFCFLLVCVPMLNPHEEAFILVVHWSMDCPVKTFQPLQLHRVQVLDGDAAHFCPGSILESIVVKELAAEQEASCQHSVDRAR